MPQDVVLIRRSASYPYKCEGSLVSERVGGNNDSVVWEVMKKRRKKRKDNYKNKKRKKV
jgi:hypothetical protein